MTFQESQRHRQNNSSLMNESYATAISMNQQFGATQGWNNLNQSQMYSEIANSPQAMDIQQQDAIDEYPSNKFKMRGYSMNGPESPSRFKLGMYRKNMVLEPPRRNNVTLKWESASTRRAVSTDKRPAKNAIINQFMNDYQSVRPGPTIQPYLSSNAVRNKFVKSAIGAPESSETTMFVSSLRDPAADHQLHYSVRNSTEQEGLNKFTAQAS